MKYVYRDDAAQEHEFDFPMGEAPSTFNDEDGNIYWRVYTPSPAIFRGSGFYSTGG